MKKKEIKGISKTLIKSLKKALTANNKSLINTLEKDMKKSVKVVLAKKKIIKKRTATAES